MDKDLFGNTTTPKHICRHMNAEYTLPLQGTVKLRSTYAPGTDTTEEVGRSLYWNGGIQGRCLDCGKQLWYGYSSIPKFIKRRLTKATLPDPAGKDMLARLKEER